MKILSTLILMLCLMNAIAISQEFQWPDGTKAAVCLTYDDAFPSQLDIAIPLLNKLNVKATFYIEGQAQNLDARMDEWRAVAANGHEIGNHTLFHPCLSETRGEKREWLADAYKMENYSVEQFVRECRVANVLLKTIDGQSERSFAYTCCDTYVGENESLLEPLTDLFPSARSIGPTPTDMKTVNVMDVPSFALFNHKAEELIEQVKLAQEHGTFVVFLFHGVDDSHLPVSSEAHEKLLDYLDQNRDTIWTDTFLNVMNHVNSEQKRLGWK